jgi:uncharacterized damage-inducible protein DinB
MNTDAFRHLYEYHFSENRKLWERYISQLSEEQFRQPAAYSRGSVCDQILHLMSCDNYWFSGLRGVAMPDDLNAADFPDQATIRAHWDGIEQTMRDYLAALQDDTLFTHPLSGGDEMLTLWQILQHITNHGTDHRAQILRLLNDLGVETSSQDYIFYIFDNS